MLQNETVENTWHVADWGPLGVLETAIKGVGIGAGIFALGAALGNDGDGPRDPAHILAAVMAGGLTTGFTGSILIRLRQREVTSLIFSILNAAGHAGITAYLLEGVEDDTLPGVFGISYIAGEAVKHEFLRDTGYTENGLDSPKMLIFARVMVAIYALFTGLMLLRD